MSYLMEAGAMSFITFFIILAILGTFALLLAGGVSMAHGGKFDKIHAFNNFNLIHVIFTKEFYNRSHLFANFLLLFLLV